MSKFGDLISGVQPVETIETPVVEETPVVDTAPASVEEPTPLDYKLMSKNALEDYGRTIGIELDRRHSKSKLIKELEDFIETI